MDADGRMETEGGEARAIMEPARPHCLVRWRDATSFLLLTNDKSELVWPRTESTVCLNDEFCPSLTTSPARVKKHDANGGKARETSTSSSDLCGGEGHCTG